MLAEDPGDAKAIAVLFPGGSGKVNIRKDGTFKGTTGNFLTRSRKKFSAHGLVTVLFDAPSDRKDASGLSFDYRMSEEYAGDIKLAMANLRQAFPALPVWLVGTSRGSTSVANAAANIKVGGPDGVVLTASVGRILKTRQQYTRLRLGLCHHTGAGGAPSRRQLQRDTYLRCQGHQGCPERVKKRRADGYRRGPRRASAKGAPQVPITVLMRSSKRWLTPSPPGSKATEWRGNKTENY